MPRKSEIGKIQILSQQSNELKRAAVKLKKENITKILKDKLKSSAINANDLLNFAARKYCKMKRRKKEKIDKSEIAQRFCFGLSL